jgi:hypothetical protein
MIQSSLIASSEALMATSSMPGHAGARRLADRLHREFGVPVGVVEPGSGGWLAWSGGEAGRSPPAPPDLETGDGVALLPPDPSDRSGHAWLAITLPRSYGGASWVALAAFADEPGSLAPSWSERALIAWGESVAGRIASEGSSSPSSRSLQVTETLIRRLRVSDPPERFQRRAMSVMLEALGVELVAWVPGIAREAVIQAGAIEGIGGGTLRALAIESGGPAIRICNRPSDSSPPGLRRFVVAATGSDGETGWLIVANPRDDRPFSVEAVLISTVASLIGTQRANARIYSDLKELLFGVIRALTSAIDAKDPYTSGHSERVARIAVRIGQELGMTPHQQGDLYLMGLLHDVGKIGVDDGLLKKPGKLTSEERLLIQSHVRIGVHILSDLTKLRHLLPGVAYHHESLDGSGYPSGLKGDAIPMPARILAVADAYDAMSSSRPYRRGMPPSKIDDEFRNGEGVQWDPRVVQALFACRPDLERIRQKGLGESLHKVINETLGRN